MIAFYTEIDDAVGYDNIEKRKVSFCMIEQKFKKAVLSYECYEIDKVLQKYDFNPDFFVCIMWIIQSYNTHHISYDLLDHLYSKTYGDITQKTVNAINETIIDTLNDDANSLRIPEWFMIKGCNIDPALDARAFNIGKKKMCTRIQEILEQNSIKGAAKNILITSPDSLKNIECSCIFTNKYANQLHSQT